MKVRKSTRHALHAAIEMALEQSRAPRDRPVSAAALAERYELPPAVVAKVLQGLARAGLAAATRGVAGGYRLARPAARVTVLEVLDVFEPPGPERKRASGRRVPEAELRLGELFDELDEQTRATLASVTLETLVRPGRRLVL